jgi:hypothetical protein
MKTLLKPHSIIHYNSYTFMYQLNEKSTMISVWLEIKYPEYKIRDEAAKINSHVG